MNPFPSPFFFGFSKNFEILQEVKAPILDSRSKSRRKIKSLVQLENGFPEVDKIANSVVTQYGSSLAVFLRRKSAFAV